MTSTRRAAFDPAANVFELSGGQPLRRPRWHEHTVVTTVVPRHPRELVEEQGAVGAEGLDPLHAVGFCDLLDRRDADQLLVRRVRGEHKL